MFLPCAPNPTTGFFFYVPKSKIIEIEMSAEDAATLIMSCGVVQPGSDPQKKIAALAEMANAARVANAADAAAGAGEGGVSSRPVIPEERRSPRLEGWLQIVLMDSDRASRAPGMTDEFTPPRSAASPHPARTDTASSAALRRARPSASDCPS